ncbi:hypothetical protein ASD8599_02815 [Ascidiaceihabitans donghaensis]|uniref:DM13 domain-containing protein n=1 Tax=Ascidiaceihabitans donghaensis TaxID=1510460 RepID=A0A2R8BG58_9RHOB|nr:DM13 domain-containing protein [Ascidiaceihabitans donghaensis]SPH22068.1 hypothetical protein ASD8599_02815 [Ascidiaceihabitans donghaensis]
MKLILSAALALSLSAAAFTSLTTSAVAETVAASGTFTGASEHITTGVVQVIKQDDGSALVVLGDDFSLDGAPDPRVGFGKDGAFVAATDLGKLENLNGKQVYKVPASVNVDDFNEVYIWCLKFGVPLGVAALQ